MTDFDNTIIGPRFEICGECSGRNTDGYDDIIHKAGCSQAPSGKRAKMQPVEVSIDDLPPELRAALRDQPSSAEPAPPHQHSCVHLEAPHAGNCTCVCGAWREAGLPGWFYAGSPR